MLFSPPFCPIYLDVHVDMIETLYGSSPSSRKSLYFEEQVDRGEQALDGQEAGDALWDGETLYRVQGSSSSLRLFLHLTCDTSST
jgi:hypothetical protein